MFLSIFLSVSLPRRAAPRAGAALALLSAATLAAPVAHAGSPPTYTFHAVGTPSGPSSDTSITVSGVNDVGQVVGYTYNHNTVLTHAFLSDPNGGALHDLGTLGPDSRFYSEPDGVNDAGQVVGGSQNAQGNAHAFLSDPNGGALHDLGTLPGGTTSIAAGVNNSGQVAGTSGSFGGVYHAFLSDPNGGALHDLGALGGISSSADGINSTGQVVGNYDTGQVVGLPIYSEEVYHVFLSDPNGGALHDLGTLPGGYLSTGTGVNDAGQVVGYGDSGGVRAFLSDPNGGALHDLGTLPGGFNSYGEGVNNSDQVVGTSDSATSGGFGRAFLFTDSQMYDLNTLITNSTGGFTLLSATGISNTGFIIGECENADYQYEAFLLTPNAGPVPEASTIVSLGLLLALGLGGLAVTVRRRKAQAGV